MGNRSSRGLRKDDSMSQLLDLKASDILPKKRRSITFLSSSTHILDALKLLAKEKILSAPVISEHDETILGFVDVLDLVTFLSLANQSAGSQYGDVVHVNVTCMALIDFSKRNPLKLISINAPLEEIVKEMSINKIHRVAIYDEVGDEETEPPEQIHKSRIKAILTQSDIMKYMGKNLENLFSASKLNSTIAELGIGKSNVACCKLTDIAANAFLEMHQKGYSALGVVNGDGALVNFLSGSHVRGLSENNLSELMLPIDEYLSRHEENTFKVYKLDTSLRNIIESVIAHRFHRVFFVDDNYLPVGLLSLTDFIGELAIRLKVESVKLSQ